MFDVIKKDLPNFPDEIIMDWLEPFAKVIGWPPDMISTRWGLILAGRPIEFWRTLKWEKKKINLLEIELSVDSSNIRNQLFAAYVSGIENPYSKIENGQARFLNAFRYLTEHGLFPKPIVLLKTRSTHDVIDGNHRFLAWHAHKQFYDGMNKIPKQEAQELKNKLRDRWGLQDLVQPVNEQEVWCACL